MSFQTIYGHYDFRVISFRLTNTPATFINLMNRVFKIFLDAFMIVIIDDIFVYSKNEGEHMEHLRVVLHVLMEHLLLANYGKYVFLLRSVLFRGHVVYSEGVEVDSKMIEAVRNRPTPLDPTDIRNFLGLARYNRRLVDGFVSNASPLNTLIQNNMKFECSEICERNFHILKNRLTSAVVFTLPNGTKYFVVYSYSSRVGLGYVLMEHGNVIAYAYRKPMIHEKNYKLATMVFSLTI